MTRLCAWLVLAFPLLAGAQITAVDTVTVEYRALLTPDATQRDVRRRAVEGALAEAVRRIAGVQVQSSAVAVKEEHNGTVSDDFVSVVQLDARGRVVDYRVLDEEWVTTKHPELGPQVYLRLRLQASVAHDVGQPDPSFRLSLSVNNTVLHVRSNRAADNDELIVTLSASQDADVTLLTVSDDSVTVLFPNEYVPRASLRAGESAQFPADAWRESGLRLRATLPSDLLQRRDVVMGIATRGVDPFAGHGVLELERWLAAIPLERRAMASTVVSVER